ncbi:hypothetical protein L3C95_02530 [Chitinophaga filiformis]|uniref:hypothetical protein n=1 Tax=Chitinophaga filiformis TaxID=104663 RepID=UPI001F2C2003|nr:hypothetical protein [Chitinophaga filiformis]MCF6401731.1 hypothetical protein [Chitinophaga filiformis]
MFNPARRNRNIGTARRGHGQNNRLVIPQPTTTSKSYYERLGPYEKLEVTINGHLFLFIVETPRPGSGHACSVADVKHIIEHIPVVDYGKLKLIILRQPKRKEEVLSSVWGRLIYSYEFEGDYYPAIILEAVDYSKRLKWKKTLSIQDQQEFERLKADGHEFVDDGRYFTAELKPGHVRHTQLYRTLLHEFGHYVHYLEVVERRGMEDEELECREQRDEDYFKLPGAEKENFAHKYAANLQDRLIAQEVIPFHPM